MKNVISKILTISLLAVFTFATSCQKETPVVVDDVAKFVATYKVVESCPSGAGNYSISITKSAATATDVLISNFGDIGSNVTIKGSVSGANITIPSQVLTVSGVSATVSGSGSIAGNLLNINYSYAVGTQGETCSMSCSKQ